MFRTVRARSLGIGLAAILVAPLVCAQIAWAQDPPPVRVRGTIERVDGTTCVVKARDGAELKLTVADNANRRHRQGIAVRHQTKLVCGSHCDAAA
jgi:hypothetical protein